MFYTGSPCPRCSGTERYTSSGGCVPCNREIGLERAKAWYQEKRTPATAAKVAAYAVRAAAKERGEKTFQGLPCKKCGGTERDSTTSKCVPCQTEAGRQRSLRYYQRHREGVLEKAKAKRAENPERYATEEFRAKQKAHHTRWRKANKERWDELNQAWKLANPEKQRESVRRYAKANPEVGREIRARRRRRGAAQTPAWLKASGQLVAIRQLYAEAKTAGMHVDHDVPIAGCKICGAVGLHVLANLRVVSESANKSKGNRCTDCLI
jgi:hypothetical protein